VVQTNQALRTLLGYEAQALQGRPLSDLVHGQCRGRVEARLEDQAEALLPAQEPFEARLVRRDGKILWASLVITALRPAPTPQEPAAFVTVEPISLRRRAEASLRESQARWRMLFESHPEPILICTDAGIMLINVSGARLLGADHPDEVVGRTLASFCRPELHPVLRERLDSAQAGVTVPLIQHELIRLDGDTRWVESWAVPLVHRGERAAQVVLRDVTEQRNLERKVLAAVDQEQRRIGYDLHDGLGQQLAATAILAKILHRKLEGHASAETLRMAQQIEQHMNRSITATQHIVRGLCPVELERYGLAGALEGLTSAVRATHQVGCTFTDHSTHVRADSVVETHLYRIGQEAMTNAVRHSGATQIQVILESTRRATELTIRDNGSGFEVAAVQNGLGLETMRYRARLLGAHFSIEPTPGSGTTVHCYLAAS
ncbi:MAG: PAS domain S-box protein, partial [Bacteroidota bacterium]